MLVRDHSSSAGRRPCLQVGSWRVDADANELDDGRRTARVEPKVMQVLVALAAAAGQVLSREELLARVWPDVVVGDEVLTQTIIKLRKALGDDSRSPSYIETIAKRGYRLIAPARPIKAVSGAAPVPVPARRRWWAVGAGFLAIALVAAVAQQRHAAERHADTGASAAAHEAVDGAPVTVTVMPFEALGQDGEHRYLARGISNDLMTDLSRLSQLRLISPSTDPRTAAAGARFLVMGSVQRDAGMLRINARLVDSQTGRQIWAERFERPFGDLFAVQDDIVRKLTAMLPATLGETARRQIARRYTRNLEAYDLFLRAQSAFLVRQAGVNDEARALYRRALALDPAFARAYAGLAMTYAMDNRLRTPAESSASQARALELAESARLIDPDIPEVYWALGFVHVQGRRHEAAIEALNRAIALNPSYADAHAFLGGIHTYLGHAAQTIPPVRTALRLNPDGGYLYFMILGRAYLYENDMEQALINLREAAARNPADIETRVHLAAALAGAGDRAGAEWEAQEIRAMQPGFSAQQWLLSYPMRSEPYSRRLTELLAQAGM